MHLMNVNVCVFKFFLRWILIFCWICIHFRKWRDLLWDNFCVWERIFRIILHLHLFMMRHTFCESTADSKHLLCNAKGIDVHFLMVGNGIQCSGFFVLLLFAIWLMRDTFLFDWSMKCFCLFSFSLSLWKDSHKQVLETNIQLQTIRLCKLVIRDMIYSNL